DGFQLMSVVDAEGYVTNYTYDHAGRKIKEERNGEQTEYTADDSIVQAILPFAP
ncbi:MAG: RHS repeat protein, partial [Verrucomicrobia bacterium]|nr:RHS repeat protein [Verrucomicrobiota bacterium]